MTDTMMEKMERVHAARTVTAKNNIKEMFEAGAHFGFRLTQKEVHNMEDFNPGVYKIYTS